MLLTVEHVKKAGLAALDPQTLSLLVELNLNHSTASGLVHKPVRNAGDHRAPEPAR